MKYKLFILLTLIIIKAQSQTANTPVLSPPAGITTVIKYDTAALRIPNKSFSIGVIKTATTGVTETKGLLKGKYSWRKYRVELSDGSCTNGKIKLNAAKDYKKGDSITVNVYTRKWLLGGKGQFLATAKIPYNYETGIKVLTKGTFSKAPGNHVQFGIRTFYNNNMSVDKWAPAKNLQDFIMNFNGGHISRSKGDLKIDNEPIKITNDKVRLIASLAKAPAIMDTLQIVMDYIYNYKCNITSQGLGHDLTITADAYFDKLINATLVKVQVKDSMERKSFNYLFNVSGGSLAVSSRGANGADGLAGFDGIAGTDGSVGSAIVLTSTDRDGNVTTTTTMGPGGDGGNGTNGSDGGGGQNGYNGGSITIYYTAAAKPYLNLITATSIPGAGGQGGKGGRGGRGGSGGLGSPGGTSGMNGLDGMDGLPGLNGTAGKIGFVQF